MKTILLKLSGPLQSWGTNSRFETRGTDLYPSKSAIIGMIAASLGYRRDEDEKIQKLNKLDFAVRVDVQGNLLKDYHIAQKLDRRGRFDRTYVTNRYYLEDATFVVGIGHEEDSFMKIIEEGLKKPYYQPFLGRRSCPLTADFFLGLYNNDVISAIHLLEWQGPNLWSNQNEENIKCPVYSEGDLLDSSESRLKKDYVLSFSQDHRRFGFRAETRKDILVKNPYFKKDESEEHDAFDNIGGV